MNIETEPTRVGREYLEAYAVHYAARDLPLALRLYRQLMASHPTAPEADYSGMQVQNIVNAVVSKQDLLAAQMDLAVAHFEHTCTT